MGTAHASITGIASSGMSGFATPLGVVPVDRDEVLALERANLCHRDEKAHDRDHGLEVQLPFLQRTLAPSFQIIPMLVGACGPEQVAALLDHSWDESTIVVVSSDLSHYLDADSAREIDRVTAAAIERLEPTALAPGDACGRHAIAGLLKAARDRGLVATTLDLRNSGDTAGPRDRVVGYGAFGFTDPS
jgi:AmmeMemoRadiSam system protein B